MAFVLEENRADRTPLDRPSPHGRLTNPERKVLAEKGKTLGKLLAESIRRHTEVLASGTKYTYRFVSIDDPASPPAWGAIAYQCSTLLAEFPDFSVPSPVRS